MRDCQTTLALDGQTAENNGVSTPGVCRHSIRAELPTCWRDNVSRSFHDKHLQQRVAMLQPITSLPAAGLFSQMKANWFHAIWILAAIGCAPESTSSKVGEPSAENTASLLSMANPESLPPEITNQFGMTFRLVTIDTSRPDHSDSFPKKSYYLQKTELQGKQHEAFRKAAFNDGTYRTINWSFNNGFPSEWREVMQYAEALSAFDTEYDYRLPTREEWSFACANGYEQLCDKDKPNVFGFVGMLDERGNAEAIDELIVHSGHEYGVLMGYWKNNWGAHNGKPKPDCPCEYWTACAPNADDSMNEIIVGRLILQLHGDSPANASPRKR